MMRKRPETEWVGTVLLIGMAALVVVALWQSFAWMFPLTWWPR